MTESWGIWAWWKLYTTLIAENSHKCHVCAHVLVFNTVVLGCSHNPVTVVSPIFNFGGIYIGSSHQNQLTVIKVPVRTGLTNAATSKDDVLAPEESRPSDKGTRQCLQRLGLGLERRHFQDTNLFETLSTKISFCLRSNASTKRGEQPRMN